MYKSEELEQGMEVYMVIKDDETSATKVELNKQANPEWANKDDVVWEGIVKETGTHYKSGEIIMGRLDEIFTSKDEVEEMREKENIDLSYNSD